MNFETSKIGSFSMIDRNTNEVVFSSINAEIPSIDFVNNREYEEYKGQRFLTKENTTMTFSIDIANTEDLTALMTKCDDKVAKIEYIGYIYVPTQARKHKSKRINKKWLKKYGMTKKKVKVVWISNNCRINEDGSFTSDVDDKGNLFQFTINK